MKIKTLIVISLLTLITVIAVKPAYREVFLNRYHETSKKMFKKTYRFLYIAACHIRFSSRVCDCLADGAIAQLSVKRLMDLNFAEEHVLNNIAPGCIE